MSTTETLADAPPQWWRLDKDALMLDYVALEQEKRHLDAKQGQILAEIESRGVRDVTGYAALSQWVAKCARVKPSEANARVKRARDLNQRRDGATEIPAFAPYTAAAAAEGDLGADQIDAVLKALHALPTTLTAEEREGGEKILTDLAAVGDLNEIPVAGKRLLDQIDPDGPEPRDPEPAERGNELQYITHRDGSHGVKVRIDSETLARLKALLDPLAKPRAATDDEGPDTRSQWERNGDAFATFVRLGMAHPDIPTQAGESVHVVVTVSLEDLKTGLGRACLDLVGDISAAEARRMACECKVIPATLGAHGEPLDLGRAQRLASPALRRALAIRDRGCAFPGCTEPQQRCTAHHIVHWAHHGETEIHNLVLLCGRHHRLVHHSDWKVRMAYDNLPEFIPPKFIDAAQTPRRNTMHTTRT
ncbi:DUF222 domain-containing protein [Amycolatopsis sp. cg5]|uniref:HNH endonuclease signature motif containing protein n=1 Tax=Amycolatopsis sp. cg5 TaxID=3238802 RepID=UPI0035231DA7